ncbi:hypothetical protein [Streptomyces sp. NPDC059371]|uniref:hypothetical protein n=1 Tax=Streptomyces sp. NPDC059371 TaxID=3346812 RepID=UPI0036AB7941
MRTYCADTDAPDTIVEGRNPNGRERLFGVKIHYTDAHGFTMSDACDQVLVSAKSKAKVRVTLVSAPVAEIDRREVNPRATAIQ